MVSKKLSRFPGDSIILNSKMLFLCCPSLVYFQVNSTSKVYSRINNQLGIDASTIFLIFICIWVVLKWCCQKSII